MKKVYALLLAFMLSTAMFAQCVIDSTNTEFIAPTPDQFPCIERNDSFSSAIQISIPSSFQIVTVTSVDITSITGFPNGISYTCNPISCSFPGGSNACIEFSGITSDPAGTYDLVFDGTATTSLGTFPFSQLAQFGFAPSYAVDVIEPGAACHDTTTQPGIFSTAKLNAMLSITPNPNNGNFQLKIVPGSDVDGEMVILDALGSVVWREELNIHSTYIRQLNMNGYARGLYTLSVRTPQGIASGKINIE